MADCDVWSLRGRLATRQEDWATHDDDVDEDVDDDGDDVDDDIDDGDGDDEGQASSRPRPLSKYCSAHKQTSKIFKVIILVQKLDVSLTKLVKHYNNNLYTYICWF